MSQPFVSSDLPASMATKTRSEKKSEHPGLFKLLGAARDLPKSELPTLRQCLQYALLIEDRSVTRMTKRGKLLSVVKEVMTVWKSANPQLPVSLEKTAVERLQREYDRARTLSKAGKELRDEYKKFVERLDKLFDICKCKCTIVECKDYDECDGCTFEAHVVCSCRRNNKIPLMELKYMCVQRCKVGEKSTMQFGPVDRSESKRLQTNLYRKHSAIKQQAPTSTVVSGCSTEGDWSDDAPNPAIQSESEYSSGEGPLVRNLLDVSKVAAAAIRYGVSNRASSAICTATLAAVKDAGWISAAADVQSVDRHKIDRAKSALMKDAQMESKKALSDVMCILFDGKKDDTKVMIQGKDGHYHQSVIKEEHYSVCSEPGGKYLTHLTVDPKERSKDQSAAQQLAQAIFDWLKDNDMCENLVAIGGDSTNVNTGWRAGAITYLEKLIGTKMTWVICALHTNELPLRHLIIDLDGKTVSDNKFSGPIGKLVNATTELPLKDVIPPIDVNIELIELEDTVVCDLSGDQKYLYQVTRGIQAGHFPDALRERNIGPHHHARWLNLAGRLCRMWCSDHGFEGANLDNLKSIVQFVVGVYVPMWFQIKVNKNWLEGPRHIVKQLSLVNALDENIKKIVMKYVKSTAWNAHSEHILQTMLASDDEADREFAVQQMLVIRGDRQFGDRTPRVRRVPEINTEATTIQELIDWTRDGLHEPVLTCDIATEDLPRYIYEKMTVPKFLVHGQSIERCVQAVTRACETVFGEDRRDGFIHATLAHRKLAPSLESKKDVEMLLL